MTAQLYSYNPSNGEPIGSVTITPIADIPSHVSEAKQAQKKWSLQPLQERARIVSQAFAQAQPHQNQLAQLLSREMGKDIRRASGEVMGAIYVGEAISQAAANALEPRNIGRNTHIHYQALGVAAVISPWNYPLAMACNLLVPALIAGNAVIFKPSEETPLIAQAFIEYINEILPENLLQIVFGDAQLGKAIVESPVNLIAFTGSKAAGIDIMQRGAQSLKRLVMELGGNDPMIVMHDADLDAAAGFAVASSVENAGQMCTSTERIYVDQRIAKQFEAKVTQIAMRYQVGPWDKMGVNIGPLINLKQHQQVVTHLEDAKQKGARFLLGSTEQQAPYIQPTVIADITADMLIEREETFGPVIAIAQFNDIDDAIARANDSEFGLGAVVFGAQGANDVANQLEAGMVAVNSGVGAGGDAPWIGAKQSGYGFHGSAEGHRQFAQAQLITVS
ncbi:aldehyde dehydrogenase family protein [Shewanella surugensis]|uniref:Aldehyde dehydrogenase family protein n=1 Tax=Shewanella surugensis TaxID=212020 RepID=A0ABT0L6F0_9GAMM|nr:aldehyde dehydrogenase family protein [Shewanella surugensis]MCL1122965.1 aldehyde dehydrogenase family protein [Shewanella surugensis]